jgi:hypothetical protein
MLPFSLSSKKMASQKLTNCGVAAIAALLRRTQVLITARQSRALQVALDISPSDFSLSAEASKKMPFGQEGGQRAKWFRERGLPSVTPGLTRRQGRQQCCFFVDSTIPGFVKRGC